MVVLSWSYLTMFGVFMKSVKTSRIRYSIDGEKFKASLKNI